MTETEKGSGDRDLEALRALHAEWVQGDFHNQAHFTEDVVWVPIGGPETGATRGRGELAESWRTFLEAWDALRIEAREIIAGPAGTYVVMQVFRGRGKASGVDAEGRNALVLTMRDGKIARMEGFWDRDAALRDAGIESP